MKQENVFGFAFNVTRQTFLASELLVAETHWSRLKGLLGTTKIEFYRGGQGLLIVPCHGVHTFGMRYPIDVVYLNAQNVVVYISENVKPWRMTPILASADTILELPARTAAQTLTEVGDEIEIEKPAICKRSHQLANEPWIETGYK
jgi:uncharacterized protein